MNEKNLRRLSRRDLLEMLLDLIKENEKLQKRNKQMEEILQDRVITILEAGSLAEASLQLNGVFQAAQNAADQYLFNVQKNCQKLEEDTRKNASKCSWMPNPKEKIMKKKMNERPTAELLEAELNRVKYKHRYYTVLKSTLYTLITVAAAAVLVATLWLPVLQIYGSS